jgi:uncharacterized protein
MVGSAASLIREARASAKISQRVLGERAGLPQSAVSAYENGRKQPSLPVLSRMLAATGFALELRLVPSTTPPAPAFTGPIGRQLQRRRSQLRAMLEEKNFGRPHVFGSVARGDDRLESDVDILFDLPVSVGLVALAAVQREAEKLLGVPVDLTPREGLKPEVAANIADDLVPL